MKQIKRSFLEVESSTLINSGPAVAKAVIFRAGMNKTPNKLGKAVSSSSMNYHGVIDANTNLLKCFIF